MQAESKHDWRQAPEAAICWAVDANGRAYYYAADVFPHETRGVWCFTDFALHQHWRGGIFELNGTDWRTTKRWKAEATLD